MRARLLTATILAAGLGLAAAVPSNAAAPQVSDPAGDANAVNGQGAVTGVPSQATTPASAGSLDITSVQWSTKFTGSGKYRTPTHMVVTMSVAAPVADLGQSAVWRATSMFGDCSVMAAYEVAPGFTPSAYIRVCNTNDPLGYTDIASSAKVSGTKIVWTVPIKQLKSYGIKAGATLDTLGGHTRLVLGAATVPQVDDASSDRVYKVGS